MVFPAPFGPAMMMQRGAGFFAIKAFKVDLLRMALHFIPWSSAIRPCRLMAQASFAYPMQIQRAVLKLQGCGSHLQGWQWTQMDVDGREIASINVH
ncbi:MAG: hypothetical protein JST45_02995 [Bacteroidetes bacterium]|nr:hypothetical protein [Bacteroidota bacterium]